jgi:hypothetical protein
MFRTEILLDGICYRITCGSRDEAVESAREVARIAGIEKSLVFGDEVKLEEALLDHDMIAWVDIAVPVTTADYPVCPSCDLQGSFNTGDTSEWCEACGYDSEEA